MPILSGEKYFHYRLQLISEKILIKYIVQPIVIDDELHKGSKPHEQEPANTTTATNLPRIQILELLNA